MRARLRICVYIVDMWRDVNVQQEIITPFTQQLQTLSVFRFVELEDDVTNLRFQFQKQLERSAGDDVLLQLLPQSAQTTVDCDVAARNHFWEVAVVKVCLQEVLGS